MTQRKADGSVMGNILDFPAGESLMGAMTTQESLTPGDWMQTLSRVLAEEIGQLYCSEKQLAAALPKMLRAATDGKLKFIFQIMEIQTGEHIQRVNRLMSMTDPPCKEKTCLAMEGMLLGVKETIEENASGRDRDLSLIAAAEKITHYQVTSYCCARDFSQLLKHDDLMNILQGVVDDETGMGATLANLTEIVFADNGSSQLI